MNKKGIRILCVEEYSDTSDLITAVLRDFTVVSVNCLATARILAAEQVFDLILLDYHLPDGIGTELYPMIKILQPGKPILLMTDTFSIDEKGAIAGGASGFLDKGDFNFVKNLTSKVTSLLEQRTAGQ
jgi:DNA-binding NtrC family response regulator